MKDMRRSNQAIDRGVAYDRAEVARLLVLMRAMDIRGSKP